MSFLDSFDFMADLEGSAFGIPQDFGMGEFGGYPEFSFDVPQAEMQPFFDLEGSAFGGMPQFYDTTTGQFVDQAGKPFDLQAAMGDTTLQTRGVFGAPGGQSERGTTQTPGMFEKGGTLGAGGSADQFLTGPVGRSLIPLLLGGGAMGLGRAMAGSPPRLSFPPFTPSASSQAGEQAVVNAYGQGVGESLPQALQLGVAGQRDIAQNLVRDIGAETPYSDPVRDAIQRELMSVLSGGGVSPTTTLRQSQEMAAERNRLYQQLGPDFELTTAGQDTLAKIRQRHNAEQFDERRGTVSAYAPLEQSRAQFAYAAPTARTGQRQQILGSIAPTQPLLGMGSMDRANQINAQLQGQEALTAFQTQAENQRQLAAGVGQLGGKVAEAITRPPNPFDLYYRNLLSGTTT